MVEIKAPEDLWASAMASEGLIERWFVADSATVVAKQAVVEVRIEDALHELQAPAAGRLTIMAAINDVIEPGSILARIDS